MIGGAITPTSQFGAGVDPSKKFNYMPGIGTAQEHALAGYGASQDIQKQQQDLANALLLRSQGQGPNPAQAALNAQTGKNITNQAALMASQRGASANPALMAKLAAQQGAATQQEAVGQGATLEAQQQIAAQQALAQQQAQMASGNVAEQNVNAGLFGTSGQLQNAANEADIKAQKINAETALGNAGNEQKTIGGLFGGVGSALGFLAHGGPVPPKGKPHLPDHLHKMASIYHPEFSKAGNDFRSGGKVPGKAEVKGDSYKNDTVPAVVSPGEVVLPRSVTQSKDAPRKAMEFVEHLQEREGKQKGYKKVKEDPKSLQKRVERLENLCGGGYA